MSALTQIAQHAWLEAQPTAKDFRRIVLVYAAAAFFSIVLFAVAATSAAAEGSVQSSIVALLFALLVNFAASANLTDGWRANLLNTDLPFSLRETDRAKSIGQLRQSIVSYAGRLVDWDGMEGSAPRPDAIVDALTFIDSFPPESVLPDKVYAPGDGEVMFQWVRPATFVEIGFYGDDTISWYARVPGRADVHGDDPFDRHLDRQLPLPLADALHSIATRA
jgi:hypothetical protein